MNRQQYLWNRFVHKAVGNKIVYSQFLPVEVTKYEFIFTIWRENKAPCVSDNNFCLQYQHSCDLSTSNKSEKRSIYDRA